MTSGRAGMAAARSMGPSASSALIRTTTNGDRLTPARQESDQTAARLVAARFRREVFQVHDQGIGTAVSHGLLEAARIGARADSQVRLRSGSSRMGVSFPAALV